MGIVVCVEDMVLLDRSRRSSDDESLLFLSPSAGKIKITSSAEGKTVCWGSPLHPDDACSADSPSLHCTLQYTDS